MKMAWRGIVDADGDVIAWPMLLLDHCEAFRTMPVLQRDLRARWRQWSPGGAPDFDPGVTPDDQALVEEWLERNG